MRYMVGYNYCVIVVYLFMILNNRDSVSNVRDSVSNVRDSVSNVTYRVQLVNIS